MRSEGLARAALGLAVAAALGSCTFTHTTSSATGSPSATASPTASATSPTASVALRGLSADQPSRWSADAHRWKVTLSWEAPDEVTIDHYEVDRDGRTIAKDVSATRFTDEGAEPGSTYRYQVRGVTPDGAATAPDAVDVTTGSPPAADARLVGSFVIKLHITSQSGLQSGAHGGGIVFVFGPRCHAGPCDVVWSRRGSSGSGILRRNGAAYAGTVRAPFLVHSCHGGVIDETLVFHLRVVEGAAFHREWRASKIDGTLDESASSSGCLTARLSYRLTGFAQH
jgi:hypothetical protein